MRRKDARIGSEGHGRQGRHPAPSSARLQPVWQRKSPSVHASPCHADPAHVPPPPSVAPVAAGYHRPPPRRLRPLSCGLPRRPPAARRHCAVKYKWIPDVKTFREAIFSGNFEPMGVGAWPVWQVLICVLTRPRRGVHLRARSRAAASALVSAARAGAGASVAVFKVSFNVLCAAVAYVSQWTMPGPVRVASRFSVSVSGSGCRVIPSLRTPFVHVRNDPFPRTSHISPNVSAVCYSTRSSPHYRARSCPCSR